VAELREFKVTVILTLTGGNPETAADSIDVGELIEYMVGRSLRRDHILDYLPICRANLLEQFPEFTEERISQRDETAYVSWDARMIHRYGQTRRVRPISSAQ